jgi:hypothetical protein
MDLEQLELIRVRLQAAVDKEIERVFSDKETASASEMMLVSEVNWVIGFMTGLLGGLEDG